LMMSFIMGKLDDSYLVASSTRESYHFP